MSAENRKASAGVQDEKTNPIQLRSWIISNIEETRSWRYKCLQQSQKSEYRKNVTLPNSECYTIILFLDLYYFRSFLIEVKVKQGLQTLISTKIFEANQKLTIKWTQAHIHQGPVFCTLSSYRFFKNLFAIPSSWFQKWILQISVWKWYLKAFFVLKFDVYFTRLLF